MTTMRMTVTVTSCFRLTVYKHALIISNRYTVIDTTTLINTNINIEIIDQHGHGGSSVVVVVVVIVIVIVEILSCYCS